MVIYGLIDPRTEMLRYIGKTSNISNRMRDHYSFRVPSTHKECWLHDLRELSMKPDIFILEDVDANSWECAERYWIEQFKFMGADLTNGTSGGDGGPPSHDSRIKISRKMRVVMREPSARERISLSLKESSIARAQIATLHAKAARKYEIVSPDGEIFKIDNLSAFCRDNKLNKSNMTHVAQGARRAYKGWSCAYIDRANCQDAAGRQTRA